MAFPVPCSAPPYMTSDPNSFAYTSARSRWPVILTGIVDDLSRSTLESDGEKAEEGKVLIEKIDALKYDVEHDRKLLPLEDDGLFDVALYNSELERQGPMSWGNAPWLYSECYLYRKMYGYLQTTVHWKDYDLFARQKLEAFKSSEVAVAELAIRYKTLSGQLHGSVNKEQLNLLFREFIDISLWGNATDLSLLTNLSLDQLQSLQGEKARKESEKNILVNDVDLAWQAISSVDGGRVDLILDNAGFEFYTDIIFALFLLDSGLADTIVLHPKAMPWFVSDVLPVDLPVLINALGSASVFNIAREEIDFLREQLVKYNDDGKIIVRSFGFWTTSLAFWEIRENGLGGGHEVWQDLKESKLAIFKGDLNYRKLTYDAAWPRTTPFSTAISPLATNHVKLISLRTCKADVVVGLTNGQEEELEKTWVDITTAKGKPETGKAWAWSGKWAVMPFSSGEK
ncbi:uncharacterized protein V1513DRAFT_439510 [Lipomyces chichibuensis]|uniref:uncharacterized protein n=1 Tax=Lipomyces chichibuensis TaxID=1546026 RepID=UPI003343EC3B